MARQVLDQREKNEIKKLYDSGETQERIAEKYGVSQATISNALRFGGNWAHQKEGEGMSINESKNQSKGKTLLIIGNGFDLAHGLHTSYADFLEYSKVYLKICYKGYIGSFYQNRDDILQDFLNRFNKVSDEEDIQMNQLPLYNEIVYAYNDFYDPKGPSQSDISHPGYHDIVDMCSRLHENAWYNYFWNVYLTNVSGEHKWVDFEHEIRDVIQWIDDPEKKLTSQSSYSKLYNDYIKSLSKDDKFRHFFDDMWRFHGGKVRLDMTLAEYSELMYDELRRLTEALEIYLSAFIDYDENVSPIKKIQELSPDYVLSFNYTDTYRQLYDKDDSCEYCYIHGECRKKDYNDSSSKIVLGIDEYLDDKDRDERNNYPTFKKFVQRVRYHDPSKYMDWQNKMKDAWDSYHVSSDVWVFGHSLDTTDKDVLRMFLQPEYTRVHIISNANDRNDSGRLITRLIPIIGEDCLIQKAGANPARLEVI